MPAGSGATFVPGYLVPSDTPQAMGYGGLAFPLEAAAALNVGDAVYVSAANRVDKVATANVAKRAGVVVGGFKTGFRTLPEVKVGTVAADAAGQLVLVCFAGRARAVADGVVAAGDRVVAAGTAGRLIAGAGLTIASGVVAVTSTAANGDIISGHGENSIVGMAITAAAGAGSEFDVLVTSS